MERCASRHVRAVSLGHPSHRSITMRRRSLIIISAALLVGCISERAAAPAADSAGGYSLHQEQEQRPRLAAAQRPAAAAFSEVTVTEVPDLPAPTLPEMPSNMLIRTATASIEVDSLEIAVAQVRQLAAQFGGYVANSGVETGKKRLRNATLEVKIPVTRFDDALSGLTPIGRVESVNVSAEDVGEEYVDVDARMENARRLERRLIDLLGTRAGKLKDVLAVETELARVREEIERYEGRMRYLKAHTVMSTISVTVHEPIPVVGSAGHSVMGEAFTQSWRNFVVLVSLAGQSLGGVLPLGLIAGMGWIAKRRWRGATQTGGQPGNFVPCLRP